MEQLSEKLLIHIAEIKKIPKPKAARYINKCIEKVSTAENIEYKEVYDAFYTFAGLASCLSGSCSKATLKKCKTFCHCVIFKKECKPRYVPQAVDINDDPDKWVIGMKTADLEEFVEYASYLYYNFDGGGLTDNSFDALEYHLNKRLKTQGRRWEKIGAEPIEKLRTSLPYPMHSLEKIKPGMTGLITFLSNATKDGMVWSEKLDGVSGMVVFKKGKITGIYTRGDGQIGGDVTYLKDYITLPKPKYKYFVVRGEFILTKKTWDEKYKGTYANARSFVSAKINTGYVSAALNDIRFVAYQIVDWDKNLPVPSKAFKILKEQKFKIPNYGVYPRGKELLVFDVITRYKKQRESSPYYIDGLVLATDVQQPLMKAFKMTLEEQLRRTKVINVDWGISRYGRYVPVAVYESVYIDGVRLHRASAHNARHINDWNMGKGTEIVIARSGDVIPVIKDVTIDQDTIPIMPSDEYDWYWSDNKADIMLKEIQGNPEVEIKRNVHFFSTIQAPQIGEGRIRKLYDAGMKTIKDITAAKKSDFQKIKGFGPKMSDTIYNNIHNTMKKTRMDRYFEAITTFKSNVGRKTLKQAIRYYPRILTATTDEINDYFKKNKIPGIGPAKSTGLSIMIPEFRKILMKLNKKDIQQALDHQEERLEQLKLGFNKKIKGKKFVMTGFLTKPNYYLEDYIWDNWGDLISTVTSDTTAVISGNIANITGKMLKANEFRIPVYSVDEFVNSFIKN